MLIDFSVTNFRSIKEKQTFSMQTIGKVGELPTNVIENDKANLIKSAIIYGRNASGKSNLLLAFNTLRNIVWDPNHNINSAYKPYKLSIQKEEKPVEFEINFIAEDNVKYNYFISFNSKEIIKEKLSFYPNNRLTKLYERNLGHPISLGESFQGSITEIEQKLYPYHSLLSRVFLYKMDSLIIPHDFFKRHFIILNYLYNDDALIKHFAATAAGSRMPNYLLNVNKILRVADTGINEIEIKENKEEDFKFPKSFITELKKSIVEQNRYQIVAIHNILKDGEKIGTTRFDIKEESAGTIKLLALSSAILECLQDGDVLIIDELDKSLHPILTRALIKIFHNKITNPNNAQLIFASHDVSLLDPLLFRRDQIWFTEKNDGGDSEYYSLADLKGVRKGISYEKYYLNGGFGAIPVVNEYDFEFDFINHEQKQKDSQ